MNIFNFVKALLPRIEKDKLLEDLRITISELDQVVIPNFQSSSDYFKMAKLKAEENKDLTDVFYRNFDLQNNSKSPTFINDIAKRLNFIKDNAVYISGLVEEIMERDIINEGLTAKKAITIRAAESISFISRFSIDLLNLVYVNEATNVNADIEENIRLSPAAIKHVNMHIAKYAKVVSDYGIPNADFSKIVTAVPDIIINSKTAASVAGIYKEKDVDPFAGSYTTGFTGNPIYHVRLLVAEWQAGRYKANKDKKKMLELRLLHLKLLQEKKNDPKIEQEINYIQGRVDKIERYLREVEDDLGEN
jgi:hypothetical protein